MATKRKINRKAAKKPVKKAVKARKSATKGRAAKKAKRTGAKPVKPIIVGRPQEKALVIQEAMKAPEKKQNKGIFGWLKGIFG